MGMTVDVVFDGDLDGSDVQGDWLALNLVALDALAASRQLRPISAFMARQELPDGVDPWDEEAEDAPFTGWYPAADAVPVVRALADAIRADKKLARKLEGAKDLLVELDQLGELLTEATRSSLSFRLQVG